MIRGTIGRGGSGKSLTTVERLWKLHSVKGRRIVSNTPLIDLRVRFEPKRRMWLPVNAKTFGEHWACEYIYQFSDIYDLDNCDVLIDEMGAWMPAHKHSSIPDEVRRFLAQDRREGVNIWWTHRTTRIFHEVWDNTAELTKCVRYGPLVVKSITDPQAKDEKPVRTFSMVNPGIYDLYQTLARVGSPETGEGYGVGKRSTYGTLRPEQRECLIRKFGPEKVGLLREEREFARGVGFARYLQAPEGSY